MVIDFGDLKKIVNQEIVDVFDHATVFNKNTPHVELAEELSDRGHNVLFVDYQPTSEMMVIDFAQKIQATTSRSYQTTLFTTSRNANQLCRVVCKQITSL